MSTQKHFDAIAASDMFRLDGEKVDICDELNKLVECIEAEEETDWYLGECGEFTLDGLIVGAYWAMADCHAGQSSPEYETQCILGRIYSPGMTCLDEDNCDEKAVYDAICEQLLTRGV